MSTNRPSGNFINGNMIKFTNADGSGLASRVGDEKNSKEDNQREEKHEQEEQHEFRESEYVDRSAQLNATLNSLAMQNVAGILKPSSKIYKKTTHKKD